MNNDRPELRIEQPSIEWLEWQRRRQEEEPEKKPQRVIIINMWGEEESGRDGNGCITINL